MSTAARPAPRRNPASGPKTPPAPAWFRDGAAPGPAGERLLLALAGLAILAYVAAALYFVFGPHIVGDYMAETDFYGAYADGAKLIQQGIVQPHRYTVIGPVYEVVLGLFGFLVPNLFLAAELLSTLSATAVLVLWFVLLRARGGTLLGLVAVAVMASNPHFLRYGYSATMDAFSLAVQAAALVFLLTRGGTRAFAIAGVLSAIAFLTRYNAIYLLSAGLGAILLGGTRAEKRRTAALAFTIGFFAPVVPWVLFSLTHGERFALQLHHNIAYEVFARAKGMAWDDYQKFLQPQFHSLWDVIARDPAAVFSRMAINVFDHVKQDGQKLLGLPVALAAIAGVVFAALDSSARRLWPIALAWALLFLTLVPVFYSERYSLALLPMYAALAALPFALPRFAFAIGSPSGFWLKPLLAMIPVALAALASARYQKHLMTQLPREVIPAASVLRQLARPGDGIITRKSHIAWHAGIVALPFPFADSLPQLAQDAASKGARWLYFSWPEAETRPHLQFLLDTSAVVPGLTPRAFTTHNPAVLYEIGPGFGTQPDWMRRDSVVAWHNLYARAMIDPRDIDRMFQTALLGRELGYYEGARRVLELLLYGDSRKYEAWLMLGEVNLLIGDGGRSETAFRRAQQLRPDDPLGMLGLGWARLIQGRVPEAGEAWRPLIEATGDPTTLVRMVSVFEELGDHEAAARARAQLQRVGASQ
jgi:4-amino-4-deoxy-L-arabinose transferase-like glycosyltransferase